MANIDKEIAALLTQEQDRQIRSLSLIPSENYASPQVLEACGSVLSNKYSEGYPGKRYYAGNANVDKIESLCIERLKKLYNVPHANVQPYSGSPANLAVLVACCSKGDTIMGQSLSAGGHLTHGWNVSVTGMYYNSVQYDVDGEGRLDYEKIREMALESKPKFIWVGGTSYVWEFDYKKMADIADEVGAFLAADISHISGLVITGNHMNPVPYVHIVTSTTHKMLRGARGGVIMVTEKGLKKDPELAQKIDKAVFPGLQGGPHENAIAGIAVALHQALSPKYKDYCDQIIKNVQALGDEFKKAGINVLGTQNHMVLLDFSDKKYDGWVAQLALEVTDIVTNRNAIPHDKRSPFYPSGLRVGTPAITTRGFKEEETRKLARLIIECLNYVETSVDFSVLESGDKEAIKAWRNTFASNIAKDSKLAEIKTRVNEFALGYPLFSEE